MTSCRFISTDDIVLIRLVLTMVIIGQ